MKILDAAIEGYNAEDGATSPYLATSPNDAGWRIGRWMRDTGRTLPRDCRTSRGDTYHINDMKVRLDYTRTMIRPGRPTCAIERID